jgi:hypothetical protein
VLAGYVSPEKANEVFEQELRTAVRVVDHKPKLNENGISVGQRAVAMFFAAGRASS